MSDRRQETRKRFTAFTPVYDLYPRTLLGYLGDLNLRGAMIIGNKISTINKATILEIIFPGELADITVVPITIPARIAWCRTDEQSQSYSIGVEFTELTPLHKDLFERVLHKAILTVFVPWSRQLVLIEDSEFHGLLLGAG